MSSHSINLIRTIERGSVFLLARWSGPSIATLQQLKTKWSSSGLPDAELHVIDWDEHASLHELPELSGKVHGWGEAFHVRHGSIVHFQVLGSNQAAIHDEIGAFIQWAIRTEPVA